MLSIVPLLRGGGLFETGAGGSAPSTWSSSSKRDTCVGLARRVLAPGPSLEPHGDRDEERQGGGHGETLDQAIKYLENARYPSRKVREIDNRGAPSTSPCTGPGSRAQHRDGKLQARFAPVAEAIEKAEARIVDGAARAQGKA